MRSQTPTRRQRPFRRSNRLRAVAENVARRPWIRAEPASMRVRGVSAPRLNNLCGVAVLRTVGSTEALRSTPSLRAGAAVTQAHNR